MAWIYLAESAESRWPFQNGSSQSPIVKTIDTPKPFCCPECEIGLCPSPQSGMTCAALPAFIFRSDPISSRAGFLAKTSVLQAVAQAWAESEVDFSSKLSVLQKKFAQNMYSWKTCLPLELEDFGKLSVHLPLFGMTAVGLVFLPQKLAPRTFENDGSSWPTPTSRDHMPAHSKEYVEAKIKLGHGMANLNDAIAGNHPRWRTPCARDGTPRGPSDPKKRIQQGHSVSLHDQVGGQLNPQWVEWLMGYPPEWTVLEDSVTPWFLSKRGRRSPGLPGLNPRTDI